MSPERIFPCAGSERSAWGYPAGGSTTHPITYGFSMGLAGGGVKWCTSYCETDDFGFEAVNDKAHLHDIHATILHQLGVDCNRLSYFFGGLDRKLVGVEGAEPNPQLIS